MKPNRALAHAAHAAPTLLVLLALWILSPGVRAAELPTPTEADWVATDFRFHTGEVMPRLRIHYTTLGTPGNPAVLVLHGTAGSGTSMMSAAFAGELFGPGQPLDASRYFIVLPDAIGTGKTTKPSDGLRAAFPKYNYNDMVQAQYRLVTEGLGLRHLRLVIGNSMGGMQTWIWGVTHPDFMDALVPMASQPTPMSGRNWLMRRMLIDAVRNDPEWNNGNYSTQPRQLRTASVFFNIATIGGTLAYQKAAPTRETADKLLADRYAAPFTADANDFLYQWESSGDYNPSPDIGKIKAALLAINSADDERNPPELATVDRAVQQIKGARLFLIPASEATRGHGTTAMATFWKAQLQQLLQDAPARAP
jgi:homoserine O-acetyltransferase